jgi:hypothetical protein
MVEAMHMVVAKKLGLYAATSGQTGTTVSIGTNLLLQCVSPITAPNSAERVTANHLSDNERGLTRPRSRVSPGNSVYVLAWFFPGV